MGLVTWGSVDIPAAILVDVDSVEQEAPAQRTGGGTEREQRQESRLYRSVSKHEGLGIQRGEESKHTNRYRSSDGIWAHQYGLGCLPPALVQQEAFIEVDFSSYRSGNKKIPHIESTLGQTKPRPYWGLGPYLLRTVSDADPDLEIAATLTNNIIEIGEVYAADGTLYFYVITDGTTDDIKVTTDPTAVSISWSTYLALSSGDRLETIVNLPYLGGSGFTMLLGKYGGEQGWFFIRQSEALNTPPIPCPSPDTRAIPNPNNTVRSAVAPATSWTQDVAGGTAVWENIENMVASDDVDVEVDASTEATQGLVAFFRFRLPTGAIYRGHSFTWEVAEKATNVNAMIDGTNNSGVRTLLAGALVGELKTDATELPTTDTQIEFGGQDDWWERLVPPTVDQINNALGSRLVVDVQSNVAGDGDVTVDYAEAEVWIQYPGTQEFVPLGADRLCIDPIDPASVYVRGPESQDDASGEEVPRILRRYSFTYHADGDWPSVTSRKIPLGFTYLHAAAVGHQALYLAGGNQSDKANHLFTLNFFSLLHEEEEWHRDQGFTEPWEIQNLWGADDAVIVDQALSDASIAQTYLYDRRETPGHPHAYGPRESTDSLPLRHAGAHKATSVLRYRYRFIPVGSASITVTRQYQPDDIALDPFAYLSGIAKQDGPLTLVDPDLDIMGAEEAVKALGWVECQSRNVSATNTIRIRVSANEGGAWTTVATFTAYGARAYLDFVYKSLMVEYAGNHSSGSAGTPNLFPIVFGTYATWPARRLWFVRIDTGNEAFRGAYPRGMEQLQEALTAEQVNNGPFQLLKTGGIGGGAGREAALKRILYGYEPAADAAERGEPTATPHGDGVFFQEVDQS